MDFSVKPTVPAVVRTPALAADGVAPTRLSLTSRYREGTSPELVSVLRLDRRCCFGAAGGTHDPAFRRRARLRRTPWTSVTSRPPPSEPAEVLRPQAGTTAPELDNYVRAFLVGVTVNVAVAFGTVWLADKTRARGWRPITVAVIAVVAGAVVSSSASLIMLGINPVTFLFSV